MRLDDAKELVRLITDKSGNSRSFVAGVVMIAPLFLRSFKIDDIVTATGFHRTQVERAVLNFYRYGIWTNDDGWCCEWGRLFAGEPEKIGEKEMFELQICFILDVLVGEGAVRRAGSPEKHFTYQSLGPAK